MIRASWQRARDEWRNNRRLRIAGLVALVFVAFHLFFALEQRRQSFAARYANDLELQARLQGMRGHNAWAARASQAESALKVMRARMPEVTGAGLAQAELQNWLTGLATRTGLLEPKVRVEEALDVPGYPEMWQVVARLDGQLPQYGDAAFLRAVSEGLPWIRTERLDIDDGTPARMALVVRGYYRRPSAATGSKP